MGKYNSYNEFLKWKIKQELGSQKKLASKLRIGSGAVSNWVHYTGKPSYLNAKKCETILGVPIRKLFPREKYGKITAN